MSAYFVVELEITNPEAMEPYTGRRVRASSPLFYKGQVFAPKITS